MAVNLQAAVPKTGNGPLVAGALSCFHCGEPVPVRGRWLSRIAGAEREMCCAGCQAVADAIVAAGLEDYYRTRTAPAARGFDVPAGLALAPSALHALARYPWPGNVRELSHAIERAVLMQDGDLIDEAALNLKPELPSMASSAMALAASEALTVDEAEERLVRQALERTQGNIQRAASLLGLSRPSLYRRMEKYGIG